MIMKDKRTLINASIFVAIIGCLLTLYGFIINLKDGPLGIWFFYFVEFCVLSISAFSLWKPKKIRIIFSMILLIISIMKFISTAGTIPLIVTLIPLLILSIVLFALFSQLVDVLKKTSVSP